MIPLEIKEYDNKIQAEIGLRIQGKRLEQGLTAYDLAAYWNVGINQVSRIETGKANCTISQLYVLSQLLECSVDYFLFGDIPAWMLTEEQRMAIINFLLAFETYTSDDDEMEP